MLQQIFGALYCILGGILATDENRGTARSFWSKSTGTEAANPHGAPIT